MINLKSLGSAFFILAIGLGLASVVFILEVTYHVLQMRKVRSRN